jgi:hypothetical protein
MLRLFIQVRDISRPGEGSASHNKHTTRSGFDRDDDPVKTRVKFRLTADVEIHEVEVRKGLRLEEIRDTIKDIRPDQDTEKIYTYMAMIDQKYSLVDWMTSKGTRIQFGFTQDAVIDEYEGSSDTHMWSWNSQTSKAPGVEIENGS